MIGFIIAVTLVALKLLIDTASPELAIIQTIHILFWWYLSTGVIILTLTTLAWAGGLGSEGARMRFGIATPLAWLSGINRMPLTNGFVFIYLSVRRALFLVGAYFMMHSFHDIGTGFIRDEVAFLGGMFALIAGLVVRLINPHFTREYPEMRTREVVS